MRIEFTPDHQIKILNKRGEKVDTRYGIKGLSVSEVLAEIFENLIKAGYSIPSGSYQFNLISFYSTTGWGLISSPVAAEVGHSPSTSSSQELQHQSTVISFEWLSYINPQFVEPIGHLLDLATSDGALPPLPTDISGIISHSLTGTGPIVNAHNAQLAFILTQHTSSSSSATSDSGGTPSNFMPHYFLTSAISNLDILQESPENIASFLLKMSLGMAAASYNHAEAFTSSPETSQHDHHESTNSSSSSSSSNSPPSDHPLPAADAPVVTAPDEHAAESTTSSSNILPTTLSPELDHPNPGVILGALASLPPF